MPGSARASDSLWARYPYSQTLLASTPPGKSAFVLNRNQHCHPMYSFPGRPCKTQAYMLKHSSSTLRVVKGRTGVSHLQENTRKRTPQGPHNKPMPGVLGGVGVFLWARFPCVIAHRPFPFRLVSWDSIRGRGGRWAAYVNPTPCTQNPKPCRGISLIRNRPPLGPPLGPRHCPAVGSYGGGGSYA